MAGLLGPEELIDDLQHTLQQRHPRPHPVRQLLLSGRLTKEQLQGWARNQFHEFRNIHRFFGIRYQKCPVPELRRMLLENMVEEEGEDLFGGKYPSHRDLWVQFAEGIGIERDDILYYEPLPGIRAALEMYVSLVNQSHWAVAIGTGLVFEGGGPKRMKEEREALEKYYTWIPTTLFGFFSRPRVSRRRPRQHGGRRDQAALHGGKTASGNARGGQATRRHHVVAERLHL